MIATVLKGLSIVVRYCYFVASALFRGVIRSDRMDLSDLQEFLFSIPGSYFPLFFA